MTLTIKGGSALRARLENVAAVAPTLAGDWADETKERIQRSKPHSTRPESSRFTTKVSKFKAGVYGAFWWIFIDRGTKAHDIFPRRRQALRFEVGSQTIFAKKVHRKRMARRPFISAAAQGALRELGADHIIQAWNGRKVRGKKKFL